MELVYLWVEDYKNIHKQGFNFSPKFNCNYDLDSNELTIDENDDHIENFFGDNINVTAIVGKNGSGKSSVLEIISSLILNQAIQKKVYLIIFYNKEFILFTDESDINIDFPYLYNRENLNQIPNYNLFGVYYSSNFTNGSLNAILELFTTPLQKTHAKTNFSEEHGYKNTNLKVQSLLNLIFNSNRFLTVCPTGSTFRIKHTFTIQEMYDNYYLGKLSIILNFMKLFGKEYLPLNIKNDDKVVIKIQHNISVRTINETNFIKKIEKFLEIKKDFLIPEDKKEYDKNIILDRYRENKDEFISWLVKNIDVNLNEMDEFELSIDEALIFFNMYIDLYRNNANLPALLFDINFKNLSSGEENLILMFALLELGVKSFIDERETERVYNIILLLDEIENNFHAKWQKILFIKIIKFLKTLINYYSINRKSKINFTILTASHSPFLLSDIPKQNIIFLDKDKDGKCKVVDGLNEKKQTFGANIHTLLSDSFFMDEGLMGEFAKGKINEIIDYLNGKNNTKIKSDEEAQKLINIIGEPIVKNQLQRILDSKRLSKVDEIDELKSSMAEMQKRIDELE